MANVLPRDALKGIRSSYRARFVLVGSLAAIVCGGIALLALAPAYVVLRIEENAMSGNVPLVALPASAQDKSDRTDISRAQVLLARLSPVASSTATSLDALNAAIRARPNGVVLQSLTYTAGKQGAIVLSGKAPSGTAVNAYRIALSADARFKSISVPISDLTGTQDGHFSVTLTGAF